MESPSVERMAVLVPALSLPRGASAAAACRGRDGALEGKRGHQAGAGTRPAPTARGGGYEWGVRSSTATGSESEQSVIVWQ